MVVDEKGLISAMKDAYKTTGYKVAVDASEGSIDYIIDGLSWAVVIEKGSLPAKVFGLIAEHIRFIGKNESNTELLGYLSKVALPAI